MPIAMPSVGPRPFSEVTEVGRGCVEVGVGEPSLVYEFS